MPRPVGRGALERPPALPRALPGLFVDHVMQTSCSGLFSVVWADAEPLPVDAAEDFDFVADLPATCRQPGTPLPREFAAAFGAGVRAMWERRGRGRPPFAARVVMRDAIWSEVDSSEHGFHAAGVIVAMEVLRCIADGREPRPVGRRSGRHRGAAPPMPRNRPPA
nr:hypothetical protein [Murinocardiopsis flavida]